jgi:hypothetical protein
MAGLSFPPLSAAVPGFGLATLGLLWQKELAGLLRGGGQLLCSFLVKDAKGKEEKGWPEPALEPEPGSRCLLSGFAAACCEAGMDGWMDRWMDGRKGQRDGQRKGGGGGRS